MLEHLSHATQEHADAEWCCHHHNACVVDSSFVQDLSDSSLSSFRYIHVTGKAGAIVGAFGFGEMVLTAGIPVTLGVLAITNFLGEPKSHSL